VSFDNSRFTFDPRNDYAGVVMEQGRVQTDADWNEWLAEIMRRVQAGTLDTLGRAAYPATTPDAFRITASSSGGSNTLQIGAGRMYVDGLLVENHGDSSAWDPALGELSGAPQPPPATPDAIDFAAQPYGSDALPTGSGQYLAYLDVWQRPVTFLEDANLVDKAIGVDTTGRIQTAWRVALMAIPEGSSWGCSTTPDDMGLTASAGRLSNGTITNGPAGPCCLTTGTGYTGVENQFYRVEIHAPGDGSTATFKWSRENASVQTAVTAISAGSNSVGDPASILTVQSLGRDQVLNFAAGNWIEITDQSHDNGCASGEMYKIDSVDVGSSTITLTSPVSGTFTTDTITNNTYTRVTRWDQSGKIYNADGNAIFDCDALSGGVLKGSLGIPVPAAGTKVVLEGGIVVDFSLSPSGGAFNSMDFWNFSARTSDGSIDILTTAPPRGIFHHYTNLSVVTFGSSPSASDCRTAWPPAASDDCGCCTYTVGDGVHSHGQYTRIQKAINALPKRGGKICILPGNYYENVIIRGLSHVVISGCGWQTKVFSKSLRKATTPAVENTTIDVAPADKAYLYGDADSEIVSSGFKAVFTLIDCEHIELTSFAIRAATRQAGVLLDRPGKLNNDPQTKQATDEVLALRGFSLVSNRDVKLSELLIRASARPAIAASRVKQLVVTDCRIKMKDVTSLWPAVYLCGDDVLFEHNRISVSPRRRRIVPINKSTDVTAAAMSDSQQAVPPAPTDAQTASAAVKATARKASLRTAKKKTSTDAKTENPKLVNVDIDTAETEFGIEAPSGVQIAGPSNGVRIVDNDIKGGARNGITLGNFIFLDENENDTGEISGVQWQTETKCDTTTTSHLPPRIVVTGGDSTGTRIAAGELLRNILIDSNRISNMGMSGIGPVGFFNLKAAQEIISIINLTIVRNQITNVLQRRSDAYVSRLSAFTYGAIGIPDVENLVVRDNDITNFGESPVSGGCGIYVFNGEMVELSRNRILETRDRDIFKRLKAKASEGNRTGILLSMVTPIALDSGADEYVAGAVALNEWSATGIETRDRPVYTPGTPALRVEENVVRTAIGQAFNATGIGTFSIANNHFASAGTVREKDKLRADDTGSTASYQAQGLDTTALAGSSSGGILTVEILNLGFALDLIESNPKFADLFASQGSGLDSFGTAQSDDSIGDIFAGLTTGGSVTFANNVCQFHTTEERILGLCSVGIFTLDEALISANQLTISGTELTAFLDLFLFGLTSHCTSNRLQEMPRHAALYSGVTFGLLNMTTQNISTYCLKATGSKVIHVPNIVIYPQLCGRKDFGVFGDATAVHGTVDKTKGEGQ